MSALLAQLGLSEETTWGAPVTPARFLEFNDESLAATYGRIESNGLRAGRLYRADDRFTTYPEGAAGDLNLEVVSKGLGLLLKHMLGGIATAGPVSGAYTHTATPSESGLAGKGLTVQVGRPVYDGSSVQPFTYTGCKVTDWEISNSVEGNLMLKLTLDGQAEDTATALATASYPTGLETLSWAGGAVTIGGSAFDCTDITIGGSNASKTDRRYLRSSPLKKEQIGDGYREGTFKLSADFANLTQRARVASATASGAMATVVATWLGKTPIGGAVYPSLQATLNARFDEFTANVGGPEAVTQDLTGVYLGVSALSLAYVTADTTP